MLLKQQQQQPPVREATATATHRKKMENKKRRKPHAHTKLRAETPISGTWEQRSERDENIGDSTILIRVTEVTTVSSAVLFACALVCVSQAAVRAVSVLCATRLRSELRLSLSHTYFVCVCVAFLIITLISRQAFVLLLSNAKYFGCSSSLTSASPLFSVVVAADCVVDARNLMSERIIAVNRYICHRRQTIILNGLFENETIEPSKLAKHYDITGSSSNSILLQ